MDNDIPGWINHPALKKSVIARMIGLSATTFQNKVDGYRGNRLTEKDIERLDMVRSELATIFQTTNTTMETAPKLTDEELEEKYRDPDEIEESRVERLTQREADTGKDQPDDPNNETVFL